MKDIKYSIDVKFIIPIVLFLIVVFRVCSYGVFELDTLYECFLCATYGMWGISVWYRITDDSCKRLFLGLSGMMMFWEIIRTIKYHHLTNPLTVRMAWYSFYIPMITLSVISFLIAKVLLSEDSRKVIRKYIGLIVIALILIALVMTNELHHLVFVFPKGEVSGDPDYTYGVGYIAVIGFILIMVIACLFNLIKKCSLPEIRKYIYIPLSIIGLSAAALILYVFDIKPKIAGINLFTIPDMNCLLQILIWESCIFIGLIPANDGYYEIFVSSSIGAKIIDKNGKIVISKKQDDYEKNENIVISNEPILGGSLSYVNDYTVINRQREELLEARETIAGENLLIKNENKLLEDKAKYQKLNKVYDEIAECVHKRTVILEGLLDLDDRQSVPFEKRLAKACFINAYIKRRSNLILQSKQDKEQYIGELYLALAESVNYLGLSNIRGFVRPYKGEEKMPITALFVAYDFFQDVVESAIDTLTAIMVDISLRDTTMSLRLVLDTVELNDLTHITNTYPNAKLISEDDETTAIISLEKGGVL